MWSVRSWFIKPLFCVWHEELCWQTAGILSVALCEWQRRFLALFSSTASLPGLFINSLFWDVFQRLQDSPILPLLDCVWLLSSPYVWCVLDSITSHLPPPGVTKRVPVRVERDFGALLGSLPGRKEPWESRVCEWQGSRVGVCDVSFLSSGALCLTWSCPKPFLWRWFSWKRRWPDSPQRPHSRALRLSQHWASVGSEEWSL